MCLRLIKMLDGKDIMKDVSFFRFNDASNLIVKRYDKVELKRTDETVSGLVTA